MFNTPILFLIFNRPDTTKEVFEQIAKVKPTKLYIAADGPRSDRTNEAELCTESKKNVEDRIDWYCDVKFLYREENLGCKLAVSSAINWFFEQEESGIILEDDCLPNISFFYFCQEMLIKYRDDNNIMCINGCNFNYTYYGASYFYSRMMNVWGWATWRRVAVKINYDVESWNDVVDYSFIRKRLKSSFFDYNIRWFKYWERVFCFLSAGEFNTWDYQWVYHQMLWGKKNVVASKNLIVNIGFRSDATHTVEVNHSAANLKSGELEFPLIHYKKAAINKCYENKVLKPMYLQDALTNTFYIKRWVKSTFQAKVRVIFKNFYSGLLLI